jgi:hypothetical protein
MKQLVRAAVGFAVVVSGIVVLGRAASSQADTLCATRLNLAKAFR